MKDVVIVGGGIAGLSAAWRLRHLDTLVLESDQRVGGRIRSEKRGRYFLNWGGHVYAGGDSATSWLLDNTGVDAVPVPGSLSGLHMNGKLLLKGRVETYPFRIPMPLSARIGMLTTGAKVFTKVGKYARIVGRRKGESEAERQQRVYDFMNDISFKEFIGDIPADAQSLFEPTVTRSAGDIDQISAGAGVGYFSLVWNIGAGLSNSIVNGPSTLTETISAALGDRVQLGAAVSEVVHKKDSVVVRYQQDGHEFEVEARTAVLATPAPVTHRIAPDLDADVRDALSKIQYGPYVSAAFLTDETSRRPWDDAYGIATPKRSFNVVLNMSNIQHGYSRERHPGSSLMTFSPGTLARNLMDLDDDGIRTTYLEDLDQVLPGVASDVTESHVWRLPLGAPYCFPGRGRLQPVLTRRTGRILLAGDYMGSLYTETAIQSGLNAATDVRALIATHRQTARTALITAS
ncbi:flavin monoamine oxidase family protein [Streptomyces sp. NPDC059524]|uniref:flavin monoamine oxidase family protein n=1 Tax=Streptomyces sp. NPDC059524 TaxID=3346856 RepID=UPI003677A0A2